MAAMKLHEASSEIRITPAGGKYKVTWAFDYRVKYGPLGWPMVQTMMNLLMGKIIDEYLQGLAQKARASLSGCLWLPLSATRRWIANSCNAVCKCSSSLSQQTAALGPELKSRALMRRCGRSKDGYA